MVAPGEAVVASGSAAAAEPPRGLPLVAAVAFWCTGVATAAAVDVSEQSSAGDQARAPRSW